MNKRSVSVIVTAAVVAALAVNSAFASVTFNPDTGKGFVGKGDVQLAYNWNNKQLQENAKDVNFEYRSEQEYGVTCEWDTEQGGKGQETTLKHHVINKQINDSVAYEVRKDARTNAQGDVTGFNLTGQGTISESGDKVPAFGDACLGNGQGTINPHITAVELVSSASGLYVTWNGGEPRLVA